VRTALSTREYSLGDYFTREVILLPDGGLRLLPRDASPDPRLLAPAAGRGSADPSPKMSRAGERNGFSAIEVRAGRQTNRRVEANSKRMLKELVPAVGQSGRIRLRVRIFNSRTGAV